MTKHVRPYLFEVLVVANLAVVAALAPGEVLRSLPDGLMSVFPLSIACAVAGALIRLAVAARQRRVRRLLTVFRSRRWLVESVRLQFGLALLTHAYGWIKLLVPIMHPRLFDRELWQIDRALFGGVSPTVFLLTLFSNSRFLRFIDISYANIFLFSLMAASSYFLSVPDSRRRVAYMTSNAMLWLAGAWLYVLVPSLGPAYRFPDVWLDYAGQLTTTQHIQALLMRNYQNVIRLADGVPGSVKVVYGIAAFPSLHVAFQVFAALWMRREWKYGEVVFGICSFFILLGSMITGWHYLVDGVAGIALAFAAYAAAVRIYGLGRGAGSTR